MHMWDYNLFIGDDTVDVHVSFAIGDSTYIIGEMTSSDEGNLLKEALDSLKTHLSTEKPTSLAQVVAAVEAELEGLHEDLVSFACVYVHGSVMYIVSRGKGEVSIMRDGLMQKLVSGDKTASGYVKDGDYFMLANATFSSSLDVPFLQELLSHTRPQEVIETITPQLKGTNNVGMIALFMQLQEGKRDETADTEVLIEEEEDINEYVGSKADRGEAIYSGATPQVPDESPYIAPKPSAPSAPSAPQRLKMESVRALFAKLQGGSSRSRKVTFGIVVVLLVILSWSVISGNARRQKATFVERVSTQGQLVEAKLAEANKLAGLNTQKSLQLIDESRQIVSELQQEARAKKLESLSSLAELSQSIDTTEQGIKKAEKGSYDEFYDLELISKGAHATALYSDGESLALLDADSGKVYVLDIAEKSVDTFSASQVKKASFVSIHQREPYIFGSSIGVYKFTEPQKAENVIPVDKEWGSIRDFWMYSGNIYLLDSGASDIHKYLVAEEGYSLKRSYFGAGEASGLSGADAMTIDSSVYVAAGTKALKFVSGVRDSFSLAIPDESSITFEDIFASPDSESVYVMDKDSQRIFIASKDGAFEKQLSADIIKTADDFVVDPEEGILILSKDRIYRMKE